MSQDAHHLLSPEEPKPRAYELHRLSSAKLKAHFSHELSKPENVTWWPFLRGYSIGYATEVIPSLVKFIILRLIRWSGKHRPVSPSVGFGKSLASLLLGLLQRIIRGLRPNGFAMACAIAMGGARWGESVVRPTMERLVRSFRLLNRHARRLVSRGPTAAREETDVSLSEGEVRALNVMSTFASASMASLVAISVLQTTRVNHKQTQSPLHPTTTPYPNLSSEKENSLGSDQGLSSKLKRPAQSSTLDLTLFFTVRALDTIIQSIYASYSSPYLDMLKRCSDIILFQLSCWRIMWCWFYKPQRLPSTYVKWISALAEMDHRLLHLIRLCKAGEYVYGQKPLRPEISEMSQAIAVHMGLDSSLGDPELIDKLSCSIIHGKLGDSESCVANSARRWIKAWRRGMGIYLPVESPLPQNWDSPGTNSPNSALDVLSSFSRPPHWKVFTVPALLFNRDRLIKAPLGTLSNILLGSSRSAAFLSTFVALTWSGVCIGRSEIVYNLMNQFSRRSISKTFLDAQVAPQLGCFLSGLSIIVENKKRRGEMALYVAMRALYAAIDEVLPARLLKHIKAQQWVSRWVERMTFALSIGTITSAVSVCFILLSVTFFFFG